MSRVLLGCAFATLMVGCASAPRESAVLVAPVPPRPTPSPPLAIAHSAPPPQEPDAPEIDITDGSADVGARAPLMGHEMLATRGNVLVLHVWASWCAPCQKAMPELQTLSAKYMSRGLSVVGISVDDEEPDALEFVKTVKVKFPTVWDGTHAIVGKWKPTTMPTTYIVDRAGFVRFVHNGFHDADAKTLEAEVTGLL